MKGYIGCCFFLCIVTDMTATPIGDKFCSVEHIGSGQAVSLFGDSTPKVFPKFQILGLNFGHLTTNISKTVSYNVTCQIELNISSTGAF